MRDDDVDPVAGSVAPVALAALAVPAPLRLVPVVNKYRVYTWGGQPGVVVPQYVEADGVDVVAGTLVFYVMAAGEDRQRLVRGFSQSRWAEVEPVA